VNRKRQFIDRSGQNALFYFYSSGRHLMRILDVIASIDPVHGGPAHTVTRLAGLLRSQGHVYDIVTLDSPRASHLAHHEVPVRALGNIGDPSRHDGPLSFGERFGYAPALPRWLRKHATEYDAVLVHGLWNYTSVATRQALSGGPTPYFVFTHGMLDPWFKEQYPLKSFAKSIAWRLNEGPLLRNAAAVFFTTEEEKLLAENAFQPYCLTPAVIGYGCSDVSGDAAAQIVAFREALPALGGRRFILFLSRLHQKKGCDLLIDAFARFADKHPDVDLVIAGPDQIGLQAGFAAQAAACGVADRIHWPGYLDGDRRWGAYRASEAFILPSHSESFGVVVAEALSCAKPVLITDKVNLWREVDAAGAGIVCPDTQEGVDELFERFAAMTPDDRAAMGARARDCYLKHFRIEAAGDSILAEMRSHGVQA
jgi:glycosyltransferase involved in cell wall biosynthesis